MTRLLQALDPSRRHVAIAATLLALGIALGGGGTPNPVTEVWLELLAGLAMLAWLWLPGPLRLPADPLLWLLAAIALAVPTAQLIPLPPEIWQSLPGREAQLAALRLVGESDSWRPLSVSPPRTLASLLSFVPPLLLMLMTGALRKGERHVLLAAMLAMVFLSVVLGALQLGGGGTAFTFYDQSALGVLIGFQANRNATADVLLIGLLALAAFAAGRKGSAGTRAGGDASWDGWWIAACALLLVLACVLTGSRTGIALILPIAVCAWAILALDPRRNWKRKLPAIAAGALALLASAAFVLRNNVLLQRIAARFGSEGGQREDLWRDTIFAIGQYWPYGTGMGTFVPTFIALEPLEAVDQSAPNRAHNDYLELLLEAGAFGVVALVLAIALALFMALRSWRTEHEGRPQIAFGLASLALIAVHSIMDYPLRSLSLACLAAVAVGMLARSPKPAGGASESHR